MSWCPLRVNVKLMTSGVEVGASGEWTKMMSWLNVAARSRVYYEATITFHFNTAPLDTHTATNVPRYQHTWTSPQLNIMTCENSCCSGSSSSNRLH